MRAHPRTSTLLACALAIASCHRLERGMAGQVPPPPEYVGTWEAENEKLEIESNGSIWDQKKGYGERGSFLRTDGATLVVAFVASGDREFKVESAPHRDPDSKWRMTLDGVQFVRTK